MRRKLNLKFLGWLLGVLLLSGTTVHLLHAYQVRRNAGALLHQAELASKQGHLDQAVGYFAHYLAYEPGDTDALAKYGEVLEKLAVTPSVRERALSVLEQVLRREPGRDDLREKAACLAINLSRFEQANQFLRVLLAKAPARPDLHFLQGWAREASGDYARAVASYEEVVKLDPKHLTAYERLASLLQSRLERPAQVAKLLDSMIAANPKSAEAYLLRARQRRTAGAMADAGRDVAKATELAPERADVLLAAAEMAHVRGDGAAARAHLRRGLELHPSNEVLYQMLATLELEAGRKTEAIACLRRGLEAVPRSAELVAALADVLVDAGTVAEAAVAVERLRKEGVAPVLANLLEARLWMREGRWGEARVLLEQTRPQLAGAGRWTAQADLLLARCHEQSGDTEQQLATCRLAVASNPSWPAARLALGAALLRVGQVSAALAELREAASAKDPPPDTWSLLARALLTSNLSLPEARRDWGEIERALKRAEQALPDSAEVAILRAEGLAARKQFDGAKELVMKARKSHPEEARLWAAQADLAVRQAKFDEAATILTEARQKLGERLPLRLTWLRYWAGRGGDPARQALRKLADEPNRLPAEDQARYLRDLADMLYRTGEATIAARLWHDLVEKHPQDLRSRFALFELALQKGDAGEQRRLLDDLRRLEGAEGVLWRYGEAAHLLQRSGRQDTAALKQAGKYLTEVTARQRGWARVPLLQAALAEAEGSTERAIEHYLQALQLGESQPRTAARVVRLLYERRRYAEADQALRGAEEAGPLGKDLARLGVELALRNHDYPRALLLARQVAPVEGRDYREQLWLAQVQTRADRPAAAEETLRRTTRLSPEVPDVWVALVRHLAGKGRTAEAEDVLEDMTRRLPSERAPLTLARCREALGQLKRAEQLYLATLKERPDDFMARRATVDFLLRTGQGKKAEPLLRQLIDPAAAIPVEIVVRAHRQLAGYLAGTSRPEDFREALLLLDHNEKLRGRGVEDDRSRAVVLASRPEHGREALLLLERSLEKQPLSPDEQFLLLKLNEADGKHARARDLMLNLLAIDGSNPDYLAHYIRTLLRQRELVEAQFYLEQLEGLQPQNPRTEELKGALRKARAVNSAKTR